MVNSISSIGSFYVNSISSNSNQISEETRKKLEALGIDTSNIKTEAEAKAKIEEAQMMAQSTQLQQQVQGNNRAEQNSTSQQQGNSSLESIKEDAKTLAAQMGISVNQNESISDYLNKILHKINESNSISGIEKNNNNYNQDYLNQYNNIYKRYQEIQSVQSMLTGSLDQLAMYNKIALGLK